MNIKYVNNMDIEMQHQNQEVNTESINKVFIIYLIIHIINLIINYRDYDVINTYEILFLLSGYDVRNLKILLGFVVLTCLIMVIYDIIIIVKSINYKQIMIYKIIVIIHVIFYAITIYEINKLIKEIGEGWNPIGRLILCILSIIPIFHSFKRNE